MNVTVLDKYIVLDYYSNMIHGTVKLKLSTKMKIMLIYSALIIAI